MEHLTDSIVDWGVAARPFPGEECSGDGHLVLPVPGGVVLAVADGLGHGPAAAAAARTALETLTAYAAAPAPSLLTRCHWSLRHTRGVALSLSITRADEGMMTWAGVGNVAGVLLRANPYAAPRVEALVSRRGLLGDRIPSRGGALGDSLPPFPVWRVPIGRRDTLVLATDGIRGGFVEVLNSADAPRDLADRILSSYRDGADDALVLVARYVGETA